MHDHQRRQRAPSANTTTTTTTPAPPENSTVRVVKRWVRGPSVTTIFVDRDGLPPFDASVRADSTGDGTHLVVPVSTVVRVGEVRVPTGYTATINCGAGRRIYHGGPFPVTSPATAGATRTCTIVNTEPRAVLAVVKTVRRHTIRAGQTVDFTISVRNIGRGMARNVAVCDRLPGGLVFTRAPRARLVKGDACWRIARLGPGERTFFAVRVRPSANRSKVFVNIVTVAGVNATCNGRIALSARKVGATCKARAELTVVKAAVKARAGGVTG